MSTPGETFEALADPTRRAILRFLADRDATPAGRIAEEFDLISRAAVSNHLRVLRGAGLVVEQRRGQFREYSLGPNRADDVLSFLRSVYNVGLHELDSVATDVTSIETGVADDEGKT